MSTEKKVLLINSTSAPVMSGLTEALRTAGAEVREMDLSDLGALLDALEQDWMPVVLKSPAA